ncbi:MULTISPECIES: hypothetical protein [unclassified Pantoea]|jgi:hypothetical protein|nr:hypothetical protein [Pantoea sp. MQR6]
MSNNYQRFQALSLRRFGDIFVSAGCHFDDKISKLRSATAIRSELKRIEEKRKIVLDRFMPDPYSTAPLTQRG